MAFNVENLKRISGGDKIICSLDLSQYLDKKKKPYIPDPNILKWLKEYDYIILVREIEERIDHVFNRQMRYEGYLNAAFCPIQWKKNYISRIQVFERHDMSWKYRDEFSVIAIRPTLDDLVDLDYGIQDVIDDIEFRERKNILIYHQDQIEDKIREALSEGKLTIGFYFLALLNMLLKLQKI